MVEQEYAQVRVVGAPGYGDFNAELIMTVPSADGRIVCIVGFDWEGKREVAVIPAEYVIVKEESK